MEVEIEYKNIFLLNIIRQTYNEKVSITKTYTQLKGLQVILISDVAEKEQQAVILEGYK